MGATRAAEAERLDALRRRLYEPGVTEDDVAAYRSKRRSPLRRLRDPIVAVAVLLAAAAGVAVLLSTHPLAAVTVPALTPTPSATAAGTAQSRVPASTSTRSAFVLALQEGESPGLLQYLYGHRTFLPANLRTNSRADSTEYSGRGTSTIALDPSALAQHGGRVTVIVLTDTAADFSWDAERIAQRNDRSGPVVTLASRPGSTRPGEPVSSTFVYSGTAPARLAMNVDASVRWGAVVVFTD